MLGDGHSGLLPDEYADVPPRGSGALNGPPRQYTREQAYDRAAEGGAERRRGSPIPFEQLPPWLRTEGAARSAGDPRDPRGAYGGEQAFESDDEQWWPDEDESGQQWNDWGDGEYAEYAESGQYGQYADGYDEGGYDGYAGESDDHKRGGWRRFFGRR